MTNRLVRTLLVVAALAHTSHAIASDVIDVLVLGKDVVSKVIDSWYDISEISNATGGVPVPLPRRREEIVMSRLAQISKQIRKVEIGIEKVGAMAFYLSKNLGRGTRLELRLHEMTDLLNRVSSADRIMREYVGLQQELEKTTLLDFAEWCVSHDPGALPGLLERIHSLIVPPHKHLLGQSLLQLLLERFQAESMEACTTPMSPHQVIYDIYNTVALTEIKGYAMMQFSWMLLRIYDKGNFTQEASLTRQRYSQRTAQAAAVARSALNEASRDIYMCDPPLHVEGETYDQVTRLLQGYVENEVDMNTDGTCKENCAHYTLAEKHGCYMDQFCSKQKPCKGRIIDCQYLDSDMWVCPASRNSHRRYEWIEYENGRKLGKVGSCTRGTTKVDSWWRWLFWHCSYCMCLCDDTTESDRYFSLWDATSDVKNNKVVTGVRLVKHGRVFHLQVYEGTLKGRGFVEPSGWVPIKKFDPSEAGMMDGVDYHTLTYEKRAIDLDELDSPEGYVLTGIRFRMIGAHLHFEIRSTPFNYTTGRLSPNRSQWISNDNTDAAQTQPRSKLELKKPDIPTRSHIKLQLDSHHDQYLEFTHTDFEADAAQSTVPFIDVQPVLPNKGAALATGAGVIHRGADNSGGFIALKLTTYSYARHVKAEPPPTGFTEEKEDTTEFVMAVVN